MRRALPRASGTGPAAGPALSAPTGDGSDLHRRHPLRMENSVFSPRPRQKTSRKPAAFRPRLEVLDDRTVPALIIDLTGATVTLDETAGLQNDDTSAALPAAFSGRL